MKLKSLAGVRTTLGGLIVGLGVVGVSLHYDVHLVRFAIDAITRTESFVHEIAVPIALIAVGTFVDLIRLRRRRRLEIAAARLGTLRSTMRTVQDIVNNFLNNAQVLRLDVEYVVPRKTLDLFDAAMDEAVAKIRLLGDSEAEVREVQMGIGMGVHF